MVGLPYRSAAEQWFYSESLQGLPGRRIFVMPSIGSDSNTGQTPSSPFRTMARAMQAVKSGDIIGVLGKVREQVVTPPGIFDVTIMGLSNRPRHADDHSEPGGGSSGSTWAAPASPTAETALLRILQQGWRIENLLFACPDDYGAVELVRDAGSGDAERDASHAAIVNCRFAGGQDGILSGKAATAYTEIVHNVLIEGCTFNDQSGTSLGGINGRRFQIVGNVFQDVGDAISIPAVQFAILDNVIGAHGTDGINLTDGSENVVTRNYLSGLYATDTGIYVAGSDDEWAGNYTMDAAQATATAGFTHALPTADAT